MIDARQHEYIRQNLYTSDHDYFFDSGALGEPFLDDDILHFFDGQTASLVGYSLNRELDQASVIRQVNRIAELYLELPSVNVLNYYGPWALDAGAILKRQFYLGYTEPPNPFNVDLFVDLTDVRVLKTRNARESLRKTRHRNISIWTGRREFTTHEHIKLIRKLASKDELDLCDVCYIASVDSVLRSNVITWFEARVGTALAGLAIVHEYFEGKPFLVLTSFDGVHGGVADAVYATVIRHYMEQGAQRLGLGYSAYEGLYRYKIKWGGVRCNEPYRQFVWAKPDANNALVDCIGWVSRLVLDKYHRQVCRDANVRPSRVDSS